MKPHETTVFLAIYSGQFLAQIALLEAELPGRYFSDGDYDDIAVEAHDAAEEAVIRLRVPSLPTLKES